MFRIIGPAVLLAAALPLAACNCLPKRSATTTTTTQMVTNEPPRDDIPPPDSACSGTLLTRPDLGPEWNWSGQVLPTGDVCTSVLKVEKMAPAQVNANQAYDYTLRLTNISSKTNLSDVVVTDRLPERGYDFTSSTPDAQRSAGTVVWNIGHLAPGETRNITVRGLATAEGTVMSCATVTYTPMICVTTDVVTASLSLTKTSPAEVISCDDIPIRFVVTNPGSGAANNVRISDTLPDGWMVGSERTVTFDVGTLRGGESREYTAIARSSRSGSFENRAKATADGNLSADAQSTTVVRRPVLSITKTASSETEILGRKATFTITVQNTGDAPARDFVLTDSMTGAEHIVSVSDNGTISGTSQVTWNLGTLAAGAKRTVTVTADRFTAGTISNTATATAYCAEAVTAAAAKIEYFGVPAVLLEVVDDPDPVLIGQTATYTITVTNQGTTDDSEILINCELEENVEFVSAGGATRGTGSGGKVTFEPLARLGPKAVAIWTVTVRGVKVGDSRFRCTMNTHETGRKVEETEATRIYK